MTFINFVFMGGAGIVQYFSGVFIDRAKAIGIDAPHRYAILHLAFGMALLLAAAIYGRSRPRAELQKSSLDQKSALDPESTPNANLGA